MAASKRKRPARGGAGLQKNHFEHCADNTASIDWNASYYSIFDGRACIGHVFNGRREFRAYDANERALGTFKTRDEARAAIRRAADGAPFFDALEQMT